MAMRLLNERWAAQEHLKTPNDTQATLVQALLVEHEDC